MNTYIFNEETLYIEYIDKEIHIEEMYDEKSIETNNIIKIINDSCIFYGSSYIGRKEGTKSLISESYKLPIILKENKLIVIFPLNSIKGQNAIWINYTNILSYHKISNNKVLVRFIGGKSTVFHISYFTFHNQIAKCSRLIIVYNNRNYLLRI